MSTSATVRPPSPAPPTQAAPTPSSATTAHRPWCSVGGDASHLGLCPSLAVAATAAGASTSAPIDALGRAANWAEELSSLSTSLVNVVAAIGLCSLASNIYARWKEREERLRLKRRGICRALEAWLDGELRRRDLTAAQSGSTSPDNFDLEDHLPELAGCLKAVLSHDKEAAKLHRSLFGRGGGGRTRARVALLLLWHQVAVADPDAPIELHARLVDEALRRSERRGSLTDSAAHHDIKHQASASPPRSTADETAGDDEAAAAVAEDDVRALAQLLRRPLPKLSQIRLWPAEEEVARLIWPRRVPTAEELVRSRPQRFREG